jgi:phage shock protein PspC (stress-responsive transcriptional regulator)
LSESAQAADNQVDDWGAGPDDMTMPDRRLVRSSTDKQIGGVSGGLAAYFEVDPVLIRVGFVVAAFAGFGLLAYIILWIVLPLESTDAPTGTRSRALDIAEERYARGEITAEELASIRSDLEGRP